MRRNVKFLISVTTALLVAGTLVISAPAAKRHPTVKVVNENPVTVVGRGFASGERVVVRTSVNGQVLRRTVNASRIGTFRTQLDVDAQCSPFAVTATGARGSSASTQRIRIPEACGMVIQP
jgi:hypothetical protein